MGMAPGMDILTGSVMGIGTGDGDGGSGLVGLSGGRGVLECGLIGSKPGCGSEGLSIVVSNTCAYKWFGIVLWTANCL